MRFDPYLIFLAASIIIAGCVHVEQNFGAVPKTYAMRTHKEKFANLRRKTLLRRPPDIKSKQEQTNFIASKPPQNYQAAKNFQMHPGNETDQCDKIALTNNFETTAQAAHETMADLAEKKQMIEQLKRNLCSANNKIEIIKSDLRLNQQLPETIGQLLASFRKHIDRLKFVLYDSFKKHKNVCAMVGWLQKDLEVKQKFLEFLAQRFQNSKRCLVKAKKDCEYTKQNTQKAINSAAEAQKRLDATQRVFLKIKKLRMKLSHNKLLH